MPSLAQLDQAVREFIAEHPDDSITVVVDASFGHRIDASEVPDFEAAELAGEVVSPPAGAIGRGDAFLLRIAEKTGATVLSNDSFQEFHAEHAWLFEKGRLIGGKPVPGVGWIFMDRTPVRGAKSREVVKEAKKRKRVEEAVDTDKKGAASADKAKARPKSVDRAIARATQEVVEPKSVEKSRRRRGGSPPAEPVNEPLAFITFIADHPLGAEVFGVVTEYSSHGAFVDVDNTRCYVPLSAMGDPAPRRAREAVAKGETMAFVVQAFDPPRRGIELALPAFAHIAGGPTAETVEAEITQPAPKKPARSTRKAAALTGREPEQLPAAPAEPGEDVGAQSGSAGAVKKSAAKKAPAKKAVPAKKAAAKKVGAKKKASPALATGPVEEIPQEVPGAAPDTGPSEPDGEQRGRQTGRKAAAKKAAAVKKAAPQKAAPAKKAAPQKAAPAKKAAAKKAAAKKVPAKKAAAKKETSVAPAAASAANSAVTATVQAD